MPDPRHQSGVPWLSCYIKTNPLQFGWIFPRPTGGPGGRRCRCGCNSREAWAEAPEQAGEVGPGLG